MSILHQKKEIYMANTRNLRLGANATHIPLTRVGGFALGDAKKFASPNARDTNMLVFFALGNAKVLSFALGDAKVPNANGFVSQLNIGFNLRSLQVCSEYLGKNTIVTNTNILVINRY